ncbi:hypothetical protein BHE74_00040493 [Ensete ventricosum]|nr:hypothetical protein BHE74_00040493 [Ensete ventricosum]
MPRHMPELLPWTLYEVLGPCFAQAHSVNWTPSFLLKRYILSGIRDGPHEPFIADSVDFVVGQVFTIYVVHILVVVHFLMTWMV